MNILHEQGEVMFGNIEWGRVWVHRGLGRMKTTRIGIRDFEAPSRIAVLQYRISQWPEPE